VVSFSREELSPIDISGITALKLDKGHISGDDRSEIILLTKT